MCLGVPGQVVEVDGMVARVDFWGLQKQIRLDLVDQPVAPGDYVLNHVGYAIRRIPDQEVEATMALYDELLAELEKEDAARARGAGSGFEDPMAADVRDEIAAARDGGDERAEAKT